MPPTAAQVAINLVATGDDAVIAKFNKVERAAGGIGRQTASAARSMANFGASMAQAGSVSATSLGGIASMASDIAFSFGPAGPIVGAMATAGIAIGAMFLRARNEMKQTKEEFKKSIDEMANAGDYAQLNRKARDILYGTVSDPGGLAALQQQRAELRAKLDKAVSERNLFLVSGLERGIKELDEKIKPIREQYDLVVQRIMTPDLRPGVQGMEGVTVIAGEARKQAEEVAKQRAAALAAAQKALADASKGITLTGPAVDLGLNATAGPPTIPVQVAPRIPIDEANAQLRLDMEALAPSIAATAEQTLGQGIVDGFAAAFEGKNPVAAFGKTILRGLGSMFIEIGKTLLGFGKIMAALQKFLTNIFTAGPAAIIAGAALIALGAAFTGITSGSGGGGGMGGFSSGVGNISNPANVTNITLSSGGPTRAAGQVTPGTVTHNWTVIGEGDPQAQRAIMSLINNAKRRGIS